ncbi:MAG: DegT/DnrJ/EryC1/StrS aminotransferase family protein [Syntrophales bacterium]|jgi:perosamine synthetase
MINVFKPHMGEEEINAVADVIRRGWIGLGPKTAEFEKQFAEYIGAPQVVALNSATAALDLALKLLEIKNGDEVIVPTITFVSTAHAVAYNLAYPIFVDVDKRTRNIDLKDVERKITCRTKAIIPVHYGGRPVELDDLRQVAGDIHIIEDAAHACGAIYKGKHIGSHGNISCFSFHAVKNLAMGDGGALALNNQNMSDRAKRLRWLGIDKGTWDRTEVDKSYWWEYLVDEIGLKCHLNDISAAIGLVQLKKLDDMNNRRREIKNLYNKGLSDIERITLPPDDDDDHQSSWHIYSISCDLRDELSIYLQGKEISTGVHYKPIHMYKCYGNITTLPVAEWMFKRLLSLPMYPDLSNKDVEYVVDCIHQFYKKS